MRFIKATNLKKDLENVPESVKKSALSWLDVVDSKELVWNSLIDIRQTYASADRVGKLYVFDLSKGYRIIVGIGFKRRVIYYKAILSHSEYEKGTWKSKYSQ